MSRHVASLILDYRIKASIIIAKELNLVFIFNEIAATESISNLATI